MILSLRDKELAASDCTRLHAYGVNAMAAPAHQGVKKPYDYTLVNEAAGFIITSGQAAYALPDTAQDRPVFTIGRASAAMARARGCQKVLSGPSDGAALAKMIDGYLRDGLLAHGQKLCWLRGSQISFDIASALGADRHIIDEAVVYEMQAAKRLPAAVIDALSAGEVSAIMVLSKAQLSAFAQLLHSHDLWHVRDKISLYAISPKVAKAAETDGWRSIIISRRKRALSVQAAVICDWLNEREKDER
jgi:uroporphyrinogen-III synthase